MTTRANKKPIVAIAYDFDGTLSPGNMQEYDFIPKLGIKPAEFWRQCADLAKEQQADPILAYMHLMLKKANGVDVPIQEKDFIEFGKSVKLFTGVDMWFDRINDYAKNQKVEVQHFIISSGLREMIKGTKIANKFKKIYASGFMYDANGTASWPALAVNYTTKTQYLFRINKGSLEENDNSIINAYVPDESRPVPFERMLFIGDGETDIPSMRLVKSQGGNAIAVYPKSKKGAANKAQKLVEEGRATLATVADYSESSELDCFVKALIRKVAAQNDMEKIIKAK